MTVRAPVLYNTLHRRREPLDTRVAGEVGMYTCGPTVYQDAHIGNLRTFVFEDLLRRALRFLGYRVTQVMNLTDVDDKTIRLANEHDLALDDYTAPFIEHFHRDLHRLGVEPAEEYPRATRHIDEMIAMIETLVERGHAYVADGSVWFRLTSDEDYGKLSGFDLDQARQGERVASDEYEKEDVRDFVLWKGAKEGEPSWDSPWGPGRPGWHIECSAMSMKYLGESFDLHTGGVDNIFPHHENEIAQSESATGRPFVRHWLHAEHLIVDGEKMSKSLGNQYTLDDLIERGVDPRSVRWLFLSSHYRKKLNFTFAGLEEAAATLRRFDEMRLRLEQAKPDDGPGTLAEAAEGLVEQFADSLRDDLNFSTALAALHAFVRKVNTAIENGDLGTGDREVVLEALGRVDQVLGVLDPQPWGAAEEADVDAEIEGLIDERNAARAARDFARSDEIRDQLLDRGIVLEDTKDGTRWKRA